MKISDKGMNSLFSQIVLPCGILSAYLLISAWLLPPGVNKEYAARFARLLVPATIVLLAAFLGGVAARKNRPSLSNAHGDGLSVRDLILLLLPLTPVVQYIVNNGAILAPLEAVLVSCLFALGASVPVIVVPALFARSDAFRSMMSMGLAFAFSITNMALMSRQFAWHETGSLGMQLAFFGGTWLACLLAFRFNARDFLHFAAIVFFAANSIYHLFTQPGSQPAPDAAQTQNALAALTASKKPVTSPNIYLLVYDAYVVNETMSGYGIENRAQEQFLADLGFKAYPHTYSLGGNSLATMSRVLNASDGFYGNQWKGVSGNGVVQNSLEGFGYRTYGVFPSDFFFRGNPSGYDYSFPGHGSSTSLLAEAILVGEFQFDIDFDKVSREQFAREKNRIFSGDFTPPMFLYSHSALPGHSQISGACLPNETELFRNRLAKANAEMRRDVETIVKNDPNAIVIVAGDHGPHLTKNCTLTEGAYELSEITRLDIQDRFGTFLAIRWPSSDYETYDDITVLQDLFPAVFAYLFADPSLLDAKVEPITLDTKFTSGATVVNGIIAGGVHDGEPLFTEGTQR